MLAGSSLVPALFCQHATWVRTPWTHMVIDESPSSPQQAARFSSQYPFSITPHGRVCRTHCFFWRLFQLREVTKSALGRGVQLGENQQCQHTAPISAYLLTEERISMDVLLFK